MCEGASSKLVEVVTVADIDDEDRVGNSLLQIWELKAKLLFSLWPQGLVKILNLKFRQYFEAGVKLVFCRWCFVDVIKLNLGRDSEARFGQYFEFQVESRWWCLVEILKMKFDSFESWHWHIEYKCQCQIIYNLVCLFVVDVVYSRQSLVVLEISSVFFSTSCASPARGNTRRMR